MKHKEELKNFMNTFGWGAVSIHNYQELSHMREDKVNLKRVCIMFPLKDKIPLESLKFQDPCSGLGISGGCSHSLALAQPQSRNSPHQKKT